MRKVIQLLGLVRDVRIVVVLALGAFVFSGNAAEEELRSVKFDSRIQRVVVTEDSRHVIAILSEGGKVIDATSLELVAELDLDFEKPGPVLSRGGKLFISDRSSGLIQVFSEKDWELVNEIDTGLKGLVTVSAPSHDAYAGQFLASTREQVNLVTVADDQFRPIRKKDWGAAQFSSDGKFVIENESFDSRSFRTEDYLNGSETPYATGEDYGSHQFTHQYEQFWFGLQSISTGMPPESYMNHLGSAVIPENDPKSRVVYVIDQRGQNIEIRLMDDSFSLIETVEVPGDERRGRYEFRNAPPAVRDVGGTVTIFCPSAGSRSLVAIPLQFTPPVYADSIGTLAIPLPSADESTLVNGPEGATITDGKLSWKPIASTEAGEFNFKVKQVKDGKTSFFRKRISVLPPKSGSGRTDLVRLKAQGKTAPLTADSSADRTVILDDDQLVVLGTDGRLKGTLPLSKSYRDVACLPDGYVLLGKNGVDIVSADAKTVKHTIDIDGVELLKGALDAKGKYFYVTSKDATEKELSKGFPVFRVDLEARQAVKLPRVSGMDLALNRAGDQMVTYFSHTNIHYLGIMDYIREQVDALMSYQIDGDAVRLHRAYTDSLEGISFVKYSADDSSLAVGATKVLTRGRLDSGSTPIFSTGNFEKAERLVRPEKGWVKDVQFHPMLDLVFVLSSDHSHRGKHPSFIVAYDGKGEKVESVLPQGFDPPGHADKLLVSPDGGSLLIRARDIYGRRVLQRVGLELSSEQKAKMKGGRPTPVLAFGGGSRANSVGGGAIASPALTIAGGLGPKQMAAVLAGEPAGEKVDAKNLSRLAMPSVVVINGGSNGVGAGFFVSEDGHILTAAHCIPDLGGPEVHFYIQFPFGRSEFSAQAVVVDVDAERDLALLKVDAEVETWGVRLNTGKTAPGQAVIAIGHPGVENLSLDYTLTAGLVSSATRELEGQTFFQISAAVNPGNSGGPVFDDRGNVIGMVLQKAQLEGAGFAVPAADIAAFLDRSKVAKNSVRPDGKAITAEAKAKGWQMINEVVFEGEAMKAMIKDTKKPFTGTLAVLGNPLDFVFCTVDYRNGLPHGNLQEFDRKKQRKKAEQYVNGKKEGRVVTWYPSGNPKSEVTMMKDGKASGFVRDYPDEELAVTVAVCFENGVRHGPSYAMDPLGRLTEVAFFNQGKQAKWSRFTNYSQNRGTPLIEFSKAGDIGMIERVIKSGAKINELVGKTTPLHTAVDSGVFYVVKALLDLGAEVDLKNSDGKTALVVEMEDKQPAVEIAQLLISSGASTEGIPKEKLDLLKEE